MSTDNPRLTVGAASSERAGVDAHPRWRHKKRGTTYVEIGKAQVQAEDPLTDYEVVQVYRCEQDGTLWVRRLSEFHDGRFEALATPPAQPAPSKCEDCSGSGLALNSAGEPDICKTCGGNTVAPHGKPDGALREALSALVNAVSNMRVPQNVADAALQITIIGPVLERAKAALHSPKIAAAETSPGDVLAMKEALARAFCVAKEVNPDCLHQNYDDEPVDHTDAHGRTFHFGWRNQLHLVDAAMPFAYRSRLIAGVSEPGEWNYYDGTPISHRRYETQPLYTHPTTKPEAPAVSVEQLARTIATARGVNPDCLHQNYGDEPVDHEDAHGRTFHYGWRNQMHIAKPVAALIAGGR